jgi:hypothetical protein
MDRNEIDEMRWHRPDVPIDENLMAESLRILDSVSENRNFLDVVNWEEKAEMEEISKRHGVSASQFGSYNDDTDSNPVIEKHQSNNPKETELMDGLAGIMEAMEGLDD